VKAAARASGLPGELPAELAGLDLDDLLRRLEVDPDRVAAAFVAGSLVLGWANVDSDIDVYLLCAEPVTPPAFTDVHTTRLSRPGVPVGGLTVLGRDCDVEVWTLAQVDELVGLLTLAGQARSSSLLEGFSHFELDFVEKVSHGVPLRGAAVVARVRAAVRASAWENLLVARALDLSDIYLVDALGQADSGDPRSAVLSVKLAFGHCVDAVCAGHGSYGRSPKWRARRLASVAAAELPFEEYWRIETMAGYDDADPGRWVRDVLAVCRRISAAVPVAGT
jgi:hypothetical protein